MSIITINNDRIYVRLFMLALCLVVTLCSSQAGAYTELSIRGEMTSEIQQLKCGKSEVMIGLSGNLAPQLLTGSVISSLGIRCEKINYNIDSLDTRNVNGYGYAGTPFSARCTGKQAISGFSGKADEALDRLSIHCRNLSEGAKYSGATQLIKTVGGTGGNSFALQECPDNQPMVGIKFSTKGSVVSAIQPICNNIDPLIPTNTVLSGYMPGYDSSTLPTLNETPGYGWLDGYGAKSYKYCDVVFNSESSITSSSVPGCSNARLTTDRHYNFTYQDKLRYANKFVCARALACGTSNGNTCSEPRGRKFTCFYYSFSRPIRILQTR